MVGSRKKKCKKEDKKYGMMGEVEKDTEDFGCRPMPITNTSHYQLDGVEEMDEEFDRELDLQ